MKIFLLEKIPELCKGCNLLLKIHAFHKMTVVSLILFRLGCVGKELAEGNGAKCPCLFLRNKVVQSIESFMTSSLSRVYYVIKKCSVLFDVEIRVLLFLAHLTEILYMGQF